VIGPATPEFQKHPSSSVDSLVLRPDSCSRDWLLHDLFDVSIVGPVGSCGAVFER
jgi:hypothetical protein